MSMSKANAMSFGFLMCHITPQEAFTSTGLAVWNEPCYWFWLGAQLFLRKGPQ
jgi:hypothetical protein